MNRFAGVKPAGRRRLLPVERDGKGGKKEKGNAEGQWERAGRRMFRRHDGEGAKERRSRRLKRDARRRGRKTEREKPKERSRGERASDGDRDSISPTASGWRRGARTTLPFPPTKDRSPSSVPAWRGFPTGAFTTCLTVFSVRLPDGAGRGDKRASASRYLRAKQKR